ncbi:MAG: energy-coupled thiamine transporter ThiT [Clostridia bacterium]|nr:energy-coupled thiamine transporter ThiT [Clostridia bacterium]
MNLFLASANAEELVAEVPVTPAPELMEQAAEEAAAAAPTWGQELVEKFSETPGTVWVSLAVMVMLAVILFVISKSQKKWNAKTIAFAALAIALSFVLSCFRLYRMPQGGSVTPGSMLPLMLFSAAFGVGPGLLAGMAYGVLQYFQGGWFLNVWQFLLDYILAFAALGLCGLYKRLPKSWGLYASMALAALCRALSATLAGYMFWETDLWPSLVYNGTYLIPDTIICMVLAVFIAKPVMKVLKAK